MKPYETSHRIVSINMHYSIAVFFSFFWWSLLSQTNGPTQPEFTRFESVNTNNMVDLFTGDFTYNIPIISIPGPNGIGYALSLSYSSNISPSEDASWVGYGWTMNPGAITRNKRGFPDDVNGGEIIKINDVPANTTVGVSGGLSISPEVASLDLLDDIIDIGVTQTLSYNNYKGLFSKTVPSVSANLGIGSLNFSYEDGNLYYQAFVNPAEILSDALTQVNDDKLNGKQKLKANIKRWANPRKGLKQFNSSVNEFGRHSFFLNERSTSISGYNGHGVTLDVEIGVSILPAPAGLHLGTLSGFLNVQTPEKVDTISYYGYLYSHNASSKDILDYYTEMNFPFSKKDQYLSIPHSNADIFNVTGEGIGGSFRIYHKRPAHFSPNEKANNTSLNSIGLEGLLGPDMDVGVEQKDQLHTLSISEWNDSNVFRFSDEGDEPYYAKFITDMGSYTDMDLTDPFQAQLLNFGGTFPGTKDFEPELSGLPFIHANQRIQRSNYITWHTNEQMTLESGGNGYKRYDRRSDIHVQRNDYTISDGIGEFVLFDKVGKRYTYGLPVYNYDETSMSYSVDVPITDRKKIVHEDINSSNKTVGEKLPGAYASMFLLTEICSPDFVDINLDGPSQDDLGEYVKFTYAMRYGDNDKTNVNKDSLYRWRVPYNGLYFNEGEYSDDTDNMGSYSAGYKEIYYLEKIETKTHKAIFYTSQREHDGFDAEHDDIIASNDPDAQGKARLHKLDSIHLYVLDGNSGNERIVQRTYFEYDYQLCQGFPNSSVDSGKLTLKKIWTEHNEVYPARISPYTFRYSYPPDDYYPEKYDELDFHEGYNSEQQNPEFDHYNNDAWGNYQKDGKDSYDKFSNSVKQNVDSTFDPAAYCLKVIRLPSGGEVHVQFDQDDYAYVQDREVEEMVRVSRIESTNGIMGDRGDRYYLDLPNSGMDPSVSDLLAIAELIEGKYLTESGSERIFFKFLYYLSSSDQNCYPEYFEGYSFLKDVGVDGDEIYLEFDEGTKEITPRELCKEFYQTNRLGKIDLTGCEERIISVKDDPEKAVYGFVDMINELNQTVESFITSNDVCAKLEDTLCYFRVPLGRSKKGGGIRVKRVLSWAPEMEENDMVLYGQEFSYERMDGTSSGVALNEPSTLGSEHQLVGFLDKREDYNFGEKLLRGGEKDLNQFQGPLGLGVLPAPIVGYQRVITRNIHDEKTNPGFVVTTYYTVNDDYSFDSYNNILGLKGVDQTDILQKKDFLYFPKIISNQMISSLWATQGYRFIANDMHGKLRSVSTYAGDYENINVPQLRNLSSQQIYSYSEPGEYVSVLNDWGDLTERQLGKETEIVFDSKTISDITSDSKTEFDVNVVLIPPFFIPVPIPTLIPYIKYSKHDLSTHVTTKTIRYPSVLKSVSSFKDGVYSTSENLVFDRYTGEPIITQTFDSFEALDVQKSPDHTGNYLHYNIPAHYYYEAMGPKYLSDKYLLESGDDLIINKYSNSFLQLAGNDACDAVRILTPGDWIAVYSSSESEFYYVDTIVDRTIYIEPNPNFHFSTEDLENVNVEIIRTSRSNQIRATATSITTYGTDLDNFSVEYSEQLEERVALAEQLNNMLEDYTTSGVSQTEIFNISEGLEYKGNCYDGPHTAAVTIGPLENGDDDLARLCVPWLHSSASDSRKTSGFPLSNEIDYQDVYSKMRPGQGSTSPGQSTNDPSSPTDTTETEIVFGTPICQCRILGYDQFITGLEDVEHKNYWKSTDTIKSSPSTFEFKFTVENGISEISNYVNGAERNCTVEPEPNTALKINQCRLVLFDKSYYNTAVSQICLIYCDDINETDSIIVQSPSGVYVERVNDIMDLTYASPSLNINVFETARFGEISTGVLEIYLADNTNFDYIKLFSDNIVVDSIQYCLKFVPPDNPDQNDMCYDYIDPDGHFAVDSTNGELVFYDQEACEYTILECLNLCPSVYPVQSLKNVISASETVFSSDWSRRNDYVDQYNKGSEIDRVFPFHYGLKGHWRSWYNANYREEINGIYDDEDRIYTAGYFNKLSLFNHQHPEANDGTKWIPEDEKIWVSPNGETMETQNALDIAFSTLYDEISSLPIYTSSNASFGESSFSSFEHSKNYFPSGSPYSCENDVVIEKLSGILAEKSDDAAHSGTFSLKINLNDWPRQGEVELRPFVVTSHLKEAGFLISLWIKTTNPDSEPIIRFIDRAALVASANFNRSAKSGEWILYEAKIEDMGLVDEDQQIIPKIHFQTAGTATEIFVDDVRVQPLDAEVSCFVYDNMQRLIVAFDSQHFGTFYQYDLEGRLNKQLIETERGTFLVQENYYNTSKTNK